MIAKRIFDLFLSSVGLILILPFLAVISVLIMFDSKGGVFYQQTRVGRNKVNFKLLKFRTMVAKNGNNSLLTIGEHDARVTRVGYWLRKYKLDELPQLINIIKGDMSFVGPRPEVCKYVALYSRVQQRVLTVKPGLTDWASIKFIHEEQLLAKANNPEKYYIKYIIPDKIGYSLKYIDHHNLWIDLKIMLLTAKSILSK
ncbi:MAG TPA: sugar transferase [Pelobium sp.]|nr:sugar transferase [Pelobium sp.]